MPKKEVNSEIYKMTPSTMIELFEIDTSGIGNNQLPDSEQVLYFHNYITEQFSPVYFAGIRYMPLGVTFKNNEIKGDGSGLPRPRFTIANTDGFVSSFLSQTDGLVGAKVTRKRTFAKYLDAATWGDKNPLGTPDPEAVLADDVYYIERVILENYELVELELVSILELEDVKVPKRRMLATACSFEYRNSSGCRYSGPPKADYADRLFIGGNYYSFDGPLVDEGEWDRNAVYSKGDYVYIQSDKDTEPNSVHSKKRYYYVCISQTDVYGVKYYPPIDKYNWVADACSRNINGCLARFKNENSGEGEGLPFGGFPALFRYELEKE